MSYYIAKDATVTGEVKIGEDANIWHHATVRGDIEPISIGNNSNVQDNAVIHVDEDYPVTIGDDVTIGHGAIIHGCTIEDGALIGMGAIILNGAKIGKNSLIGAGALVTENTEIPEGSLAFGNPAKIRRELSPEEIIMSKKNAEHYVEAARKQLPLMEANGLSSKETNE